MMSPGELDARALVGRRAEVVRLEGMVAAARAGRGGAVVVEGVPGVGKSALLREVWGRAQAELPVLATTGVESEIDLPFAGLAELLAPIQAHAEALPEHQRAALRAALATGAPVATDRVVVLHAVLALVAAAAPLLLVVDDVQWLDPSSEEAVAFVARRAERLGVAVIAVRSLRGEAFEPWPDVPRVTLDDLDRPDALRLAREQGLAPPVAAALVEAVGGNPLALVEAPAELTPAQREGVALLPELLPVGQRLVRDYAARVAALPDIARRALLLAAASAGGATPVLHAALGPDANDPFAAAEDDGLVRVDPRRVRFTHPLVRSAVYHGASPTARREAHRALAAATPEPERAWHLAVAADAPDGALAARLERLGHEARERGAPASAVAILERAALLSEDPVLATARTLTAAGIALTAGRPARAESLLDALLPGVDDPATRADVQLLRGMAIQQIGRPMVAYALLDEEAERVAPHDPGRAAMLLTQASVALMAHGTMDQIVVLAERAQALAPPEAQLVPGVLHAEALVSLGEHERARARLREYAPALATLDPAGPGQEVLCVAALCHVWMEDYEDAERGLAGMIDTARARGAVGALGFPLAVLATLHMRRGAWTEASAAADEAVALGEDSVGTFVFSLGLAAVAMIAAHRGAVDTCGAAAERMLEIGGRLELVSTLACAEQALGLLWLGLGDPARAAPHLERAGEHVRRLGNRDPSFLFWAADLAEARVRLDRAADVAALGDALAAGAARTGGAWATAAAARVRALTAPDDELDALLRAALAAHDRASMPFERARTLLCFGERLRRARRRADARALLDEAHRAFVTLGAAGFAERAAHELAATGGAAGALIPTGGADGMRILAGGEALTAREREVCELVAAGATNREAAERLFLSDRTVEHHLRQSYRKLGVRSRTELALRWGA